MPFPTKQAECLQKLYNCHLAIFVSLPRELRSNISRGKWLCGEKSGLGLKGDKGLYIRISKNKPAYRATGVWQPTVFVRISHRIVSNPTLRKQGSGSRSVVELSAVGPRLGHLTVRWSRGKFSMPRQHALIVVVDKCISDHFNVCL